MLLLDVHVTKSNDNFSQILQVFRSKTNIYSVVRNFLVNSILFLLNNIRKW